MNNYKHAWCLLLFFLATQVGSSLSIVATFISVESAFGNLSLLGVALSFNTIIAVAFGYLMPSLSFRFGLSKVLAAGQIIGLISVGVFWQSFERKSILLLALAVVLAAFQRVSLGVALTAGLKKEIQDEDLYRKFSARREFIGGISMVVAGLAAPLIIHSLNLNWVWVIDFISFLIAFAILPFAKMGGTNLPKNQAPLPSFPLLTSPEYLRFFLSISAALLGIGLLPLMAGSETFFSQTSNFLIQLKKVLWSVEGLMALTAGIFYLRFHQFLRGKNILFLVNLWPLLIFSLWPSLATFILLVIWVPLTFNFAFMTLRDDLLVSCQNDHGKIEKMSAYATLARAALSSVSPLALGAAYGLFQNWTSAALILIVQIFLAGLSMKFRI